MVGYTREGGASTRTSRTSEQQLLRKECLPSRISNSVGHTKWTRLVDGRTDRYSALTPHVLARLVPGLAGVWRGTLKRVHLTAGQDSLGMLYRASAEHGPPQHSNRTEQNRKSGRQDTHTRRHAHRVPDGTKGPPSRPHGRQPPPPPYSAPYIIPTPHRATPSTFGASTHDYVPQTVCLVCVTHV